MPNYLVEPQQLPPLLQPQQAMVVNTLHLQFLLRKKRLRLQLPPVRYRLTRVILTLTRKKRRPPQSILPSAPHENHLHRRILHEILLLLVFVLLKVPFDVMTGCRFNSNDNPNCSCLFCSESPRRPKNTGEPQTFDVEDVQDWLGEVGLASIKLHFKDSNVSGSQKSRPINLPFPIDQKI
jgi:hypothetical protein